MEYITFLFNIIGWVIDAFCITIFRRAIEFAGIALSEKGFDGCRIELFCSIEIALICIAVFVVITAFMQSFRNIRDGYEI